MVAKIDFIKIKNKQKLKDLVFVNMEFTLTDLVEWMKTDVEKFKSILTLNVIEKYIIYEAVRRKECHELLKYCLDLGADANINAFMNWTPLHIAAEVGIMEAAYLILDYGGKIDALSTVGTPLTIAIINENYAVAKLLIDRGAKLERVDETVRRNEKVQQYLLRREDLRRVIIYFIGCHKYKLQLLTRGQDVNVLRLIGKHIWSQRLVL